MCETKKICFRLTGQLQCSVCHPVTTVSSLFLYFDPAEDAPNGLYKTRGGIFVQYLCFVLTKTEILFSVLVLVP